MSRPRFKLIPAKVQRITYVHKNTSRGHVVKEVPDLSSPFLPVASQSQPPTNPSSDDIDMDDIFQNPLPPLPLCQKKTKVFKCKHEAIISG
jgi:hypothetical protein